MKTLVSAIALLSILLAAKGQDKSYWKDAPVTGTKIYSIFFSDENTGMAVSAQKDYFFTSVKGKSWLHINENDAQTIVKPNSDAKWSTDVFCSVMHTKDGGESWSPYNNEQQDHFCAVYLKDQNVGYKTGCDFLTAVTASIIASMGNGTVNTLRNEPQQCTEYYSDEDSGWALGWSAQLNIW